MSKINLKVGQVYKLSRNVEVHIDDIVCEYDGEDVTVWIYYTEVDTVREIGAVFCDTIGFFLEQYSDKIQTTLLTNPLIVDLLSSNYEKDRNANRVALDFAHYDVKGKFINNHTPNYPDEVVKSLIFSAKLQIEDFRNSQINNNDNENN